MTKQAQLDIGLLVLGYSRPELFEAAARSFKNLGLPETVMRYGVIDGPRDSSGKSFAANRSVQEHGQALLEEGILDKLTIRPQNLGTMRNVHRSVSEVLEHHDYVFVLEDDLEVLRIANGSIEPLVEHMGHTVRAFGLYCNRSFTDRVFLSQRFGSQAWGTSRAAWQGFDLDQTLALKLTPTQMRELRHSVGSDVMSGFSACQNGTLDSWAFPWNVHNFLHKGTMIYPPRSYIRNNSHLAGAERTFGIEFDHEIANQSVAELDCEQPEINLSYLRHFRLSARLMRRLRAKYSKRH